MAERQIRLIEQFFERLEWLLPEERGTDGTPSITDFLVHDLPNVRDRLAEDYERNTLATGDPDVRVYIGVGALVSRFAIYTALEGDDVEAFWLTIEDRPDSPSTTSTRATEAKTLSRWRHICRGGAHGFGSLQPYGRWNGR